MNPSSLRQKNTCGCAISFGVAADQGLRLHRQASLKPVSTAVASSNGSWKDAVKVSSGAAVNPGRPAIRAAICDMIGRQASRHRPFRHRPPALNGLIAKRDRSRWPAMPADEIKAWCWLVWHLPVGPPSCLAARVGDVPHCACRQRGGRAGCCGQLVSDWLKVHNVTWQCVVCPGREDAESGLSSLQGGRLRVDHRDPGRA